MAPKTALVGAAVDHLGGQQDHAGAGAEGRHPVVQALGAAASASPSDSSSSDIVVDSPPGRTRASTSARSAGSRTSHGCGTELSEGADVLPDVALQGEHSNPSRMRRGHLAGSSMAPV